MATRAVIYFAVLASLAAIPGLARAVDRIKPKEGPTVSGLTEISRFEVVVRQGAITKKVPVNEIEYMVFEMEPIELQTARVEALKEEYDEALKTLAKIKPEDLRRPETKAEFQFYKAISSAQLAIGEGSPKAITDAGRQLMAFEKSFPDSFHYLQACEMLGDLLVSLGKYDMAATYYEKLSSAPWPDYKLHAGVLLARSLQSQKKYQEAISKYDEILAMDAEGKDVDREKSTARLGRAISLAGSGKSAEAIKLLQQLIEKAGDADGDEYYARAYNALGTCYKSAGKNKDALQAFLHTDLMYSKAPAEHAEALANLAVLWPEVNQGNRGKEAIKTLKEKYPLSEWAKPGAVK
jgi:tetratricopeptide (TPR) repeat protein